MRTQTTPLSRESGIALVAVILILALLLGLGVSLTTTIISDTQMRGAFQRTTAGFYAAESGLNRGMGTYRNLFLGFRVPTSSDFAAQTFDLGSRQISYELNDVPGNPESITIPAGQVFGGLNSLQYTYIAVSKAGVDPGGGGTADTEASVGAEFDVGYIPIFQFVAFYSRDLEILPGPEMHLHGRVHTNGDLYLNADSSTGSTPPCTNCGGGFFIEDNPATNISTVQVTAKGDIHRGRKNSNDCNGTVYISMLQDANHDGRLDPRQLSCNGGSSVVPPSTLSAWKGSIVSRIRSISVPQPDITAKGGGIYWTNADLRIVLNLTTQTATGASATAVANGDPAILDTIEVQDSSGSQDTTLTQRLLSFLRDKNWNTANSSMPGTMPIFYTDVPAGPGTNCSDSHAVGCNNRSRHSYLPNFRSDNRVYSLYSTDMKDSTGAFTEFRRGGFYDNREQKWMYLLNINLHDLLGWNMAQPTSNRLFDPSDTTDGGIVIYASVQGPDSNGLNNYGVRIFGSNALPFPPAPGGDPTGVTVVSDQAVYVLGDFNSAATIAAGKQPAAIIGDTINILSNNYFSTTHSCTNDCQSNLSLGDGNRNAADTTINTAFLGGVDDTTGGAYNGGLENYPRFHESWSGDRLTYRGSFVSLGLPEHKDGSWVYGSPVYNAPIRRYDYDPDFNEVQNLPPLTPRFVYVQQVLFTQEFK